ncbi:hypothetical protein [Branchiibius cervicis]|uniref:Uncharacterized protein n=1 Tax=Branchiibius cervicis TaxID=908252 RepID=A0ABW2AS13_9MICO
MKTCPTCSSRLSRPTTAAAGQPLGEDERDADGDDAGGDETGGDDEVGGAEVTGACEPDAVTGAFDVAGGADTGELHAATVSTVPAIVTISARLVTQRP